jgi:hypothetical protein
MADSKMSDTAPSKAVADTIALDKSKNFSYSEIMNTNPVLRGFSKGVSYLTFFPDVHSYTISPSGAWLSVSGAFRSVGNNIRKAMYDHPTPSYKKTK